MKKKQVVQGLIVLLLAVLVLGLISLPWACRDNYAYQDENGKIVVHRYTHSFWGGSEGGVYSPLPTFTAVVACLCIAFMIIYLLGNNHWFLFMTKWASILVCVLLVLVLLCGYGTAWVYAALGACLAEIIVSSWAINHL